MTRPLALVAAVCLAAACSTTPAPPPPPGAYDAGPATCAEVCAHWVDIRCAEAANPKYCVGACFNVTQHPEFGVTWNLACRAQVTSCDQIDRCEAK